MDVFSIPARPPRSSRRSRRRRPPLQRYNGPGSSLVKSERILRPLPYPFLPEVLSVSIPWTRTFGFRVQGEFQTYMFSVDSLNLFIDSDDDPFGQLPFRLRRLLEIYSIGYVDRIQVSFTFGIAGCVGNQFIEDPQDPVSQFDVDAPKVYMATGVVPRTDREGYVFNGAPTFPVSSTVGSVKALSSCPGAKLASVSAFSYNNIVSQSVAVDIPSFIGTPRDTSYAFRLRFNPTGTTIFYPDPAATVYPYLAAIVGPLDDTNPGPLPYDTSMTMSMSFKINMTFSAPHLYDPRDVV